MLLSFWIRELWNTVLQYSVWLRINEQYNSMRSSVWHIRVLWASLVLDRFYCILHWYVFPMIDLRKFTSKDETFLSRICWSTLSLVANYSFVFATIMYFYFLTLIYAIFSLVHMALLVIMFWVWNEFGARNLFSVAISDGTCLQQS